MDEYISLVQCFDSVAPLMNVQLSWQRPEPIRAQAVDIVSEERPKLLLSEFNQSVEPDDSLIKRTAIWMINQIKLVDPEYLDKYTIYFDLYGDYCCGVSISCLEPVTTEAIRTFSFSINLYNNQIYGKSVRIDVSSLFINKKYANIGSTLLDIVKSALKSIVNVGQYYMGTVELWSVETAVVFYIKNGFVVRSIFEANDPQQKSISTHKILHFAMKENNIDIMKQYAKVNSENFLEFVQYLLEKTKYGRYFKAYFNALEKPDEIEKSVMQSKFISSIFESSMIFPYFRDLSKSRVTLKPLTV